MWGILVTVHFSLFRNMVALKRAVWIMRQPRDLLLGLLGGGLLLGSRLLGGLLFVAGLLGRLGFLSFGGRLLRRFLLGFLSLFRRYLLLLIADWFLLLGLFLLSLLLFCCLLFLGFLFGCFFLFLRFLLGCFFSFLGFGVCFLCWSIEFEGTGCPLLPLVWTSLPFSTPVTNAFSDVRCQLVHVLRCSWRRCTS